MRVRKFNASVKQISTILRSEGKHYSIPRYQRGYAWTRSQVGTLWNDLIEEEWPGMFIGTLLLNHGEYDEDRIEVIDGQQRLLTITILFSVIRDNLENLGDSRTAQQIHSNYIADSPYAGEQKIPKIIPGLKLQQYFLETIQTYPNTIAVDHLEPNNDDQKRIKNAHKYLKTCVNKLMRDQPNDVDRITKLVQLTLKLEKLTVVAIDVEDEEDAYSVFESVNAKGASLTLADILKNMIFRKLRPDSGDEDIAQIQWDKIIKNLEGTSFSMSKFIRYHWLSKHDFLTESKLYEAIKQELEINKSQTWEELLDNLVSDSRRLKNLINAEEEDFLQYNSPRRVSQSLFGMSQMGVSQVYVILLSINRNVGLKKKWQSDFAFLENFCFNYHTISKLQAVRVERKYSHYARKIENLNHQEISPKGRTQELDKILREMQIELSTLKDEFVIKENFIIRFCAELQYSTSKKKKDLLRYVLVKINDYFNEGTGELMINSRMTNLEHILPQKPEQWGFESGEIEEYVNNIGNITILSKKLNSIASNKPLNKKLSILSESELAITLDLVNFIEMNNFEWNEELINKRSKHLAEISFEKIWRC